MPSQNPVDPLAGGSMSPPREAGRPSGGGERACLLGVAGGALPPGAGETVPGMCPSCGRPGRAVKLATVKSLLSPEALARLDAGREWYFCPQRGCDVVYFSDALVYRRAEVRVPVFQKDPGEDVPVCYCFGWTRRRIREEVRRTGRNTPAEEIATHVRAGRCACEIRNPQGGCCLPNVRATVAEEAAGSGGA